MEEQENLTRNLTQSEQINNMEILNYKVIIIESESNAIIEEREKELKKIVTSELKNMVINENVIKSDLGQLCSAIENEIFAQMQFNDSNFEENNLKEKSCDLDTELQLSNEEIERDYKYIMKLVWFY